MSKNERTRKLLDLYAFEARQKQAVEDARPCKCGDSCCNLRAHGVYAARREIAARWAAEQRWV